MPHFEETFALVNAPPPLSESTGVLAGGALSINSGDNTKFDMAAGVYAFVDYTYDPSAPQRTLVPKEAVTAQTVTNIGSQLVTYVGVDVTGAIIQSAIPFTNAQRRTIAQVGVLVHSNMTNLNAINDTAGTVRAGISQLYDLMTAVGPMNVSGNVVGANGANLNINKSAGTVFKPGCNFQADPLNPHLITLGASVAPATIRYRLSNSTEYANTAVLDPLNFESPLGTRVNLSGANKFSVQRIALFTSNLVRVQYGQTEYNSMAEAEAAIATQSFSIEENIAENGVVIAYVILRRSTTDLTNTNDAKFLAVGKFGNVSSGGQVLASTDDLPEGSVNLYFTDARARAAVITAAITNGDTTHSPSGDAVFDALALTQPLDATLTGIAALTPTANQGIYASGADVFSAYSLTAGGRALGGVAGTADTVPYFSALNVVSLATQTAFARTLIDDPDAATARATLGLVIGTNVQAWDAELQAIAGLVSAADQLPYFTGAGTAALTTLTSFSRTLLDDTTAAAAATTLGLGTGDTPTFTGVTTTGLATLTQAANAGPLQATKAITTAVTPPWQMNGTTTGTSAFGINRWSANTVGTNLLLSKSRGASIGTHTVVADGDSLGMLGFMGSDGAAFFEAARITAAVQGAPAAGSVPGALQFLTTAVGAGSATAALTLNANGSALFAAAVTMPTTVVVGNTNAIPSNTRVLIDRIGTGTLPTLPGGTSLTLQGNNASTNNNYLVNIAGATGQAGLRFGDSAAASQGRIDYDNATDSFDIYTNATLALSISSSAVITAAGMARLPQAIGSATAALQSFTTTAAATPNWQMVGTTAAESFFGMSRFLGSANGPSLFIGHSRGATVGSFTVVQDNDLLGTIAFFGSDGTSFREGARIQAEVNGTPGAGDMPGRLVLMTSPDGAAAPVAALTLAQDGAATFASTIAATSLALSGGISGANISNTYTPTLTGVTNVSASSANLSAWIRIGNAVIVFARVSVTATTASAVTEIRCSLPVASNFASATQCVGSGSLNQAVVEVASVGVQADAANDEALFRFVSTSTGARVYTVVFGYIVI